MEGRSIKKPTLVFDLDDTVFNCTLSEGSTVDEVLDYYVHAQPIEGAVEAIRNFKSLGYNIIFDSARLEEDRAITELSLKEHGIPYDGLELGKPRGRVYVDDRAFRFAGTWTTEKVKSIHEMAQKRFDY